jgi:hypothetical protein
MGPAGRVNSGGEADVQIITALLCSQNNTSKYSKLKPQNYVTMHGMHAWSTRRRRTALYDVCAVNAALANWQKQQGTKVFFLRRTRWSRASANPLGVVCIMSPLYVVVRSLIVCRANEPRATAPDATQARQPLFRAYSHVIPGSAPQLSSGAQAKSGTLRANGGELSAPCSAHDDVGHVKVPPLDPLRWGVWLTTHTPLLNPTRRRLQRGF